MSWNNLLSIEACSSSNIYSAVRTTIPIIPKYLVIEKKYIHITTYDDINNIIFSIIRKGSHHIRLLFSSNFCQVDFQIQTKSSQSFQIMGGRQKILQKKWQIMSRLKLCVSRTKFLGFWDFWKCHVLLLLWVKENDFLKLMIRKMHLFFYWLLICYSVSEMWFLGTGCEIEIWNKSANKQHWEMKDRMPCTTKATSFAKYPYVDWFWVNIYIPKDPFSISDLGCIS